MAEDKKFTIKINDAYDQAWDSGLDLNDTGTEFASNVTYDTSGATVGGFSPAYTVSTGTDTSSEFNVTWDTGDNNSTFVDHELVESNPTCKALWDQFIYVYEMIKSDKENEEDDVIPF